MADKIAPYINPILNALRRLGGSERRKEIITAVIQDLGLEGSPELDVKLRSGVSAFENKLTKALRYLNMSGYVEKPASGDKPTFGVWALTEKGQVPRDLSEDEIANLLAQVRKANNPAGVPDDPESDPEDDGAASDIAHRPRLLAAILRLSPAGFERFCESLLRASGFAEVRVTGRSGDGGIDGIGILRINSNPFVSYRVVFQCKRYDTKRVGSPEVRNLHGAMHGRSDHGIILTTSTFTADAITEATRDGAPMVELIDGDQLVTLCENLRLGLIPRTLLDVDTSFFSQFDAPQG